MSKAPLPGVDLRTGDELALVAHSTRGSFAECWHFGAAAVVSPPGEVKARIGNPHLATATRSVAKPLQALPLLLAGGVEAYSLEPADLALICASHSGREEHIRRVVSLLKRGGFDIADLRCGAHPPFDAESARRLVETGQEVSPLHNNCSGKHAGMLLTCRLLDLPWEDYLLPAHPLQKRILNEVARLTGRGEAGIELGTDGCGLPTYRLSLAAIAKVYAALAAPRSAALPAAHEAALGRLADAMRSHPEMVAGRGRFTSRLMEVTAGSLLAKEGAMGLFAVAVEKPERLGVVVKIADGSEQCRDAVVVEVLRQLGSLTAEEVSALGTFHRPQLESHAGRIVGEVVPDLELLAS